MQQTTLTGAKAPTPQADAPGLTAYHTPGRRMIDIVPAGRWRDWMEATDERWANRCLPLLMANESGWWLLNPHGFTAVWDGGKATRSIGFELDEPLERGVVASMFGYGIITWTIPYLFRTDPGWNLLARGPANQPKDGVSPLEGLVETDWSTATFTMNWKLTRPGLAVRFDAGEPFCMIVPQRRNELESFDPRRTELAAAEKELASGYRSWERSRDQLAMLKFVSEYGQIEGFDPKTWEQDYFKGRTPDGTAASEHQTKRRLRAFADSAA